MEPELDIARIVAGDRDEFRRLVVAYQGKLFGFFGRMGLDPARAEEIAQETFLRVWINIGDYRPRQAAFPTWLFTIARNLALNARAAASARLETPYGDTVPERAADAPAPPDALEQQQRHHRLRQALLALPAADGTVLALAYTHDLPHAAIARIEGCSVGAVKLRIHRAKQRLRALMEERDG